MRKRTTLVTLVTLAIVVAISVTSILLGRSMSTASSHQQKIGKQDLPGTISGTENKDLIPDQAAYAVFLRFAAHATKSNKAVLRSYLKSHGFDEAEIGVIQAVAVDFRRRVAVLDKEVEQLKDENWPNPDPSVMGRLSELQQQKEILISEIADSLPGRLGSRGEEKMSYLIKDKLKAKMKIAPAPAPPGGPGWNKKHH